MWLHKQNICNKIFLTNSDMQLQNNLQMWIHKANKRLDYLMTRHHFQACLQKAWVPLDERRRGYDCHILTAIFSFLIHRQMHMQRERNRKGDKNATPFHKLSEEKCWIKGDQIESFLLWLDQEDLKLHRSFQRPAKPERKYLVSIPLPKPETRCLGGTKGGGRGWGRTLAGKEQWKLRSFRVHLYKGCVSNCSGEKSITNHHGNKCTSRSVTLYNATTINHYTVRRRIQWKTALLHILKYVHCFAALHHGQKDH